MYKRQSPNHVSIPASRPQRVRGQLDDGEDGFDVPANLLESRALKLEDLKVTPEHKIMSFNAQSINNKFQSIRDIVHKCDPIALCIQET